FSSPNSYLALRGPWKNGDTIELSLPMDLYSWQMPDDQAVQAAMFGPLLLAARRDEAPHDRWYGEMGPFQRPRGTEQPPLPVAAGKVEEIASWVRPAANQPVSFQAAGESGTVPLVPINQIVHEHYDVYWKVAPKRTESSRGSAT